jgi:hypothetical protein
MLTQHMYSWFNFNLPYRPEPIHEYMQYAISASSFSLTCMQYAIKYADRKYWKDILIPSHYSVLYEICLSQIVCHLRIPK